MTASDPDAAARPRYRRRPPPRPVALTPNRLAVLKAVGRFGICTSPQLVAATGLHPKAAQRAARALFDGGFLEVVAISRAALLEPSAEDPHYPFGSAPNLYCLSRKGKDALAELEADVSPGFLQRPSGASWIFVRHEVFVTDAFIFFGRCAARYPGHRLEVLRRGREAEMGLGRAERPKVVRPDGWFLYRLGSSTLVGILEVDRSSERRAAWKEKIAAYDALFSGHRLLEITGKKRARLLVLTPDRDRRDGLARLIAEEGSPAVAERTWLAERQALETPDLSLSTWVQPGKEGSEPLVSASLLGLNTNT